MAVFELPVGDDPDQTNTFTLDNKRYDLRIKYTQRLGNVATGNPTKYDGWKLYVSLSGQDPFIETPLKTSRNLLEQHRYKPDCPKGVLVLTDFTAVNAEQDPSYNYSPERVDYQGLGKQFKLIYIDNT